MSSVKNSSRRAERKPKVISSRDDQVDICVCKYCGHKLMRSALPSHVRYSCEKARHHREETTGRKEEWICKTCKKKLKTARTYLNHIRVCNKNDKYSCKHCGVEFKSPGSLQSHVLYSCDKARNFRKKKTGVDENCQCDLCGLTLKNRRTYRNHRVLCKNKTLQKETGRVVRFKCRHCGEMYASPDTLGRHILEACNKAKAYRERKSGIKEVWKCDICRKKLKNRRTLRVHRAVCMNKKLARETGILIKYNCKYCMEKFTSKESLRSHILSSCDNARIEREYIIGKKEMFNCDLCGRVLKNLRTLRNHRPVCPVGRKKNVKKHAKSEEIRCQHCSANFRSKDSVYLHVLYSCIEARIKREKTDEEVQTFQCQFCKKDYDSELSRYQHVKMYCRAASAQKQTSSEVVKCAICYRHFASKLKLNFHLKKGCNVLVEWSGKTLVRREVYICKGCNKIFISQRELNKHFYTECILAREIWCNEGVGENQNGKIKAVKEAYSCEKCDEVFSSKKYKKEHLRYCNKLKGYGKKYPCFKCHVVLQSDHEMQKHMKSIHKKVFFKLYFGAAQRDLTDDCITRGLFICCGCGKSFGDCEICRLHILKCLM